MQSREGTEDQISMLVVGVNQRVIADVFHVLKNLGSAHERKHYLLAFLLLAYFTKRAFQFHSFSCSCGNDELIS